MIDRKIAPIHSVWHLVLTTSKVANQQIETVQTIQNAFTQSTYTGMNNM